MKTFSIKTLGCKVNQYESQHIRELLEKLGLVTANSSGVPDLFVINSCCVTQAASAKSRQYISKARKTNPEALIIVRGCLPSAPTGELKEFDNGIHLIDHQQDLQTRLTQIVNSGLFNAPQAVLDSNISKTVFEHKIKNKNKLPEFDTSSISSFKGQTRAFLKIQDGCDGFCTYCIVRKTRPALSSKPLDIALNEARALVAAGHKEIVLTGIFLGAFGKTTVRRRDWDQSEPNHLVELLEQLCLIPGLARVRLSSLEPGDVTPELLDSFCRHKSIIAQHLHLPLQSGSEAILKRMCRQYTASQFLDCIDLLKSRLDRPAITTDIIVGFPGETDDDFNRTIELAKKAGFSKMHIFPFSPRKGTPAYEFKDKIDPQTISRRTQELAQIDIQLQQQFRSQFIGESASIIVESTRPRPHGRTERYFLAAADCSASKNELVSIKLTPDSFTGLSDRD